MTIYKSVMNLGQTLEKLQNRAARIITGSNWDVRSVQILRALKWKGLAEKQNLMFKTVNNVLPEYPFDKFANINTDIITDINTDIIFGAPKTTCLFHGQTLRLSKRIFVIRAQ